jgi:hypothetical protein
LLSGLITKKCSVTIHGISGKLSCTDGCPVQYKSRNCFGFIKNICTEHDYDLFIRNSFETSHANSPQDDAGGFLKNQVDLVVYRGSEIIQTASDFFNSCENHLKDTKSNPSVNSCITFTLYSIEFK